MSAPQETIGYGRTTVLPEKRGIDKAIALSAECLIAPPTKGAPPTESLAVALYAEWWKKRYPSARLYPWEQMRVTCPRESEAWLAVADMAILNLCS